MRPTFLTHRSSRRKKQSGDMKFRLKYLYHQYHLYIQRQPLELQNMGYFAYLCCFKSIQSKQTSRNKLLFPRIRDPNRWYITKDASAFSRQKSIQKHNRPPPNKQDRIAETALRAYIRNSKVCFATETRFSWGFFLNLFIMEARH